jgi:hypothetical protein
MWDSRETRKGNSRDNQCGIAERQGKEIQEIINVR